MSTDRAFDLITEPVIGVRLTGERQRSFLSLPGVLAALARDMIEEFPALRPHQRHPWHAFTVQLAAMTLHRAGSGEPPSEETVWATLLRGLTPEWPNDAPWCLVSPANQPAFMQAPAPGGNLSDYKTVIDTPDALDLLVTSKNHDPEIRSDDRRSGGGLAVRADLAADDGRIHGRGELRYLPDERRLCEPAGYRRPPRCPCGRAVRPRPVHPSPQSGQDPREQRPEGSGRPWPRLGSAVGWCRPAPILGPRSVLHRGMPARAAGGARRHARGVRGGQQKGTDRRRGAEGGRTGDPWTPIELTDGTGKAWGEPKALTITGDGFSYQKMTELLLRKRYHPAIAQEIADDDAETGLAVVAAGLARGQGKTEGYHERIVPITQRVLRMFRARATDALAGWAAERVEEAGKLRGKVLRPALFTLLQDGPDEADYRANDSSERAAPFLGRFDRAVDATFFNDLWKEAEQADAGEEARRAVRFGWHQCLAEIAQGLLVEASDAVPHASMRRYRVRVRAEALFFNTLHKHFPYMQSKESSRDDV